MSFDENDRDFYTKKHFISHKCNNNNSRSYHFIQADVGLKQIPVFSLQHSIFASFQRI
jgi:hypothetical protein